jgi:hypothetical protein
MAHRFPSLHALVSLSLGALVIGACGGAQPEAEGDPLMLTTAKPLATSDDPAPKKPEKTGAAALSTDQRQQMEIALRRGGEKAAKCVDVVADAKGGEGEVKVLFDGTKGRVTEATVGAPWAGTPVESCIRRSFVGEIIMPFDGEPLEVPYTVKLQSKAPAADPKKKK